MKTKRIMALLTTFLLLQSPLTAGAEGQRTITISPDNIVKIEVTDQNGTIMEDVIVNLHDETGTSVCMMQTNLFAISGNGSPIRMWNSSSPFSCDLSWEMFTALAQPNILQEVRRLNSFGYGVYNESRTPSQSFGTTETYQLCGFSPDAEAAFTLPAGQIAFYADAAWNQKPVAFSMDCQRGTIHVNRQSTGLPNTGTIIDLDVYPQNGMLQLYPSVAADDSPLLLVSFLGGSAFLGSYHAEPVTSTEDVEYELCRLHMQDLFVEANADGTVTIDGRTYDLRNDTEERGAMLLLQSGAAVTAAIPDAQGYVQCYVSRANRYVDAELITNFEDGTVSGCDSTSGSAHGGYTDTVNITTVTMPDDDSMYLTYVPAGTYTLTYEGIPEGYSAPETTEITITDSKEIGYFRLVLGGGILYGDVNCDTQINAADAAAILVAAAAMGAGEESGLTETQITAADLNADGTFDATDAALILQYAAYAGAGGEMTLEEFLAEGTIS